MKAKMIITEDGKRFSRVSGWIDIQTNYNPHKNNSLWDYVTDGAGYRVNEERFNPEEGLYLNYFTFRGVNYAIESFYRCGSAWIAEPGHRYTDAAGTHNIGAVYMDGSIWGPYMYIELDKYGEAVRVYMEEV